MILLRVDLHRYFNSSQFLKSNSAILIIGWSLVIALFCLIFNVGIPQLQTAVAQTLLGSSEAMIKELLSDANRTLTNGDTTRATQNLLTVQRLLTQGNENNSSSIQSANLLIRESVTAIANGKPDIGIHNLESINELLFAQTEITTKSEVAAGAIEEPDSTVETTLPHNDTSKNVSGPLEEPSSPGLSALPNNITTMINNQSNVNFLPYSNPSFGVKMEYPNNWSARGYSANSTGGNNTIAGFYSPSKTASELGNISGVTGRFVPYLDIFVFDSNNMSLDEIIDGRINRIHNSSNFLIHDSNPFTLKSNHSAHKLIYSTAIGGDELFKKMQVYSISGTRVYLISFTAQEALFTDYLPIVEKMMNSVEITNLTKTESINLNNSGSILPFLNQTFDAEIDDNLN